jgi:hypothetical protein
MDDANRFYVLMAASVAVLAAVIWAAEPASARKSPTGVLALSALASAGGMSGAKSGAGHDWPVALCSGPLAAATVFLPPLYFRRPLPRAAACIVLAALSAPAIRFSALRFFGWDNHMPFLNRAAWRARTGAGRHVR